jgi:hypothetical protein
MTKLVILRQERPEISIKAIPEGFSLKSLRMAVAIFIHRWLFDRDSANSSFRERAVPRSPSAIFLKATRKKSRKNKAFMGNIMGYGKFKEPSAK